MYSQQLQNHRSGGNSPTILKALGGGFFTNIIASFKIGAAKMHKNNTSGPKLMKTFINKVCTYSFTLYCELDYFFKNVVFFYSTLRDDLNTSF